MNMILDFHTHRQDAAAALIAVDPQEFDPSAGLYYAVGYHPWHDVGSLTSEDFALLERYARHPQVLAVGETGMDALRGGSLDVQADVFVRHLQVAREVGKPVVVHCVRTAQQIIAARRRALLDDVPLAIHGMRSNEHVARMLLDAGCYLSFGPRFNPRAVQVTPLERLLIETDEDSASIDEVAARVASALDLPADQVKQAAAGNAQRLLNG